MDKRSKVVLGVVLIFVGLWLSASSIEDFLNPIKFVSEVTAQPGDYVNRNVQVAGLIVKETLQRGEEPNSYIFDITDGKATIKVKYKGLDPVPDVKPGVGVTAIWTLAPDGTLNSNKVLLKCPSKYQEELDKVYLPERFSEYEGGAYTGI